MIEKPGVICGGCTVDPYRCKAEYEREGYVGTIYIAETENMKKAEDKLLAHHEFWHKVQQSSNAEEKPGHIYVIQGKRMEKDTLDLQEVTQAEVFLKIEEAGGIYSGHTTEPHRRRSEHEREGYRGSMCCAKTKNMKRATDELFASHDFCYNTQQSSSAEEKPGYIYIIQGWKR